MATGRRRSRGASRRGNRPKRRGTRRTYRKRTSQRRRLVGGAAYESTAARADAAQRAERDQAARGAERAQAADAKATARARAKATAADDALVVNRAAMAAEAAAKAENDKNGKVGVGFFQPDVQYEVVMSFSIPTYKLEERAIEKAEDGDGDGAEDGDGDGLRRYFIDGKYMVKVVNKPDSPSMATKLAKKLGWASNTVRGKPINCPNEDFQYMGDDTPTEISTITETRLDDGSWLHAYSIKLDDDLWIDIPDFAISTVQIVGARTVAYTWDPNANKRSHSQPMTLEGQQLYKGNQELYQAIYDWKKLSVNIGKTTEDYHTEKLAWEEEQEEYSIYAWRQVPENAEKTLEDYHAEKLAWRQLPENAKKTLEEYSIYAWRQVPENAEKTLEDYRLFAWRQLPGNAKKTQEDYTKFVTWKQVPGNAEKTLEDYRLFAW